jgi:hypothetical protein
VTYFALVFLPILALTLYTVVKSRRLSESLKALSGERLQRRDKLNVLLNVWKRKGRVRDGSTRSRPSL